MATVGVKGLTVRRTFGFAKAAGLLLLYQQRLMATCHPPLS